MLYPSDCPTYFSLPIIELVKVLYLSGVAPFAVVAGEDDLASLLLQPRPRHFLHQHSVFHIFLRSNTAFTVINSQNRIIEGFGKPFCKYEVRLFLSIPIKRLLIQSIHNIPLHTRSSSNMPLRFRKKWLKTTINYLLHSRFTFMSFFSFLCRKKMRHRVCRYKCLLPVDIYVISIEDVSPSCLFHL